MLTGLLLMMPIVARAQTMTTTTTLGPGPTMQNPETHGTTGGGAGGMPPGTGVGTGERPSTAGSPAKGR